jgi:hypothetical protein
MSKRNHRGGFAAKQQMSEQTRQRQRRFEVRCSRTGDCINMDPYSTRIDDNTTLEWILPQVAQELSCPIDYVELTAGTTCVRYVHRLKERTHTLMMDLNAFEDPLIIEAARLPRPQSFEDGGACLCAFGGCCCYCMAPGAYVCSGCGNNCCCRSGNCGHQCCEHAEKHGLGIFSLPAGFQQHQPFTAWCPKVGCRPGEWMKL